MLIKLIVFYLFYKWKTSESVILYRRKNTITYLRKYNVCEDTLKYVRKVHSMKLNEQIIKYLVKLISFIPLSS